MISVHPLAPDAAGAANVDCRILAHEQVDKALLECGHPLDPRALLVAQNRAELVAWVASDHARNRGRTSTGDVQRVHPSWHWVSHQHVNDFVRSFEASTGLKEDLEVSLHTSVQTHVWLPSRW
eukprot:CAMPEP_0176406698 /NCGR_PEP_ID=MMETSP0127-20121128/1014_1 /TAXON_ID=938130 /ORGANISM="Platyophrya macrostoma, Strain WH" /LENGTH=122 /DNA_ID=CAMNT_0017785849 /DNA_START=434 /DNA_END=799 /DNA_ORIENTATION=-